MSGAKYKAGTKKVEIWRTKKLMGNEFLGKIKSQAEVIDHEFILILTFSVMCLQDPDTQVGMKKDDSNI